jgi:hypothetical protein
MNKIIASIPNTGPKKAIPIVLVISLLLGFLAYRWKIHAAEQNEIIPDAKHQKVIQDFWQQRIQVIQQSEAQIIGAIQSDMSWEKDANGNPLDPKEWTVQPLGDPQKDGWSKGYKFVRLPTAPLTPAAGPAASPIPSPEPSK